MKFIMIFLLSLSSAFASNTLNSINDCTTSLYENNPRVNSYVIKNSRVSGEEAKKMALTLTRDNARVNQTVDALGVARFNTITLTKVLETDGGDTKSCGGAVFASKTQICTQDQSNTTCEVRCDLNWTGRDCR